MSRNHDYDPYSALGSSQGGGGYGGAGGANQYGNYSTQDLHGYGATPNSFSADPSYAALPAANAPRNSVWLEKQQARSRRSKWIIMGVIGVVAVIAIGVGVGVAVSNSKKHQSAASSSSSSSSSNSSSSSSSTSVTGSNPNDPSDFQKNASFHQVFYGMAYSPIGAVYPACGATQDDVTTDIQLMSQLTDTIRLYSADCNVTAFVLNAIQMTKVTMNVYLGNFIVASDNTAYTRQKAAIDDALAKYGVSNVLGITVGNEVMLNACTDAGVSDPNSAAVATTANYVVTCIKDTRSSLTSAGYTNIKVGNSDAGSYFSSLVLENSDYGMANVHPWFAQTTITDAANWTWSFFQDTDVDLANSLSNKPEMFIAETGWPTGSKDAASANDGAGTGGEASVANLQTFLDTFVCQSNTQGVKYFYFELFDEAWKNITYGGVEGYWGLLDQNKYLKEGLTIPTCS